MRLNDIILKGSEELFSFMRDIRRQIHQYPEVGMKEFRTTALIRKKLDEMGIPYRDEVGGTGIVGLITGNGSGKVIGLRADMDALTIHEATGAEYASKIDGVMHACGHDAHVAMLLGAARLLNKLKDEFKGSVKLLFQPAEEGPGGAKPMIEDGALKDPRVDAVVGFHVSSGRKTGLIGIKRGPTHAAMNEMELAIIGKSGHAAYPQNSIDAIYMAARVITGLQSLISRRLDPLEPGVITIGTIKGGYRLNIIADRVEMKGTIRYLKEETGDKLRGWIEDMVSGVTGSMGGSYELKFPGSYPPAVNNPELADKIDKYLTDLLGKERIFIVEKPTMGSEDFAYFDREVPGAFLRLGSGGENGEFSAPHHHQEFDIDEKALITGCAAFAKISVEFLNED